MLPSQNLSAEVLQLTVLYLLYRHLPVAIHPRTLLVSKAKTDSKITCNFQRLATSTDITPLRSLAKELVLTLMIVELC